MSFRLTGATSGGLMYGLDKRYSSSESDDTDYSPGEYNSDITSSSSESDEEEIDVEEDCMNRKKRPWSFLRKSRNVFSRSSSDSSEDDQTTRAPRKKNCPSTRLAEKEGIARELALPVHDSPPSNETWASLTTEILTRIFAEVLQFDFGVRYLCRCSQVCANWNAITTQSIGWQGTADLSFLGGHEVATDEVLASVTPRFTELRGLDLSGWRQITNVGIDSVAEHCRKLEYLNLSNCQKRISKITGNNILDLAENTQLKRVNFSNLKLLNATGSLKQFIEIRGEWLTHFYLSENVSVGSAVMTTICNSCPNLLALDLSNTSVRSVCFKALKTGCPKLRELFLANLALELKNSSNVTEENDLSGFQDLQVLNVSTSTQNIWVIDSLLKRVLSNAEKLHTLDMRGNRSITHEGLEFPSNNVKNLYMGRTTISEFMIYGIREKWGKSLRDLDFSWADAFGMPFDYLLEHLFHSQGCCELTRLNLAGTAISDVSVRTVLNQCPELVSLDLSSCRGVSRGQKRFHDGVKAIQKLRSALL